MYFVLISCNMCHHDDGSHWDNIGQWMWGPSIIMTPLMSRTIRLSVYQLSLSLSPAWLPGQQPLWGPGLSIWNNELSPPSIPANSGWPPPITHSASLLNKMWATWNWNLFVIFRNWWTPLLQKGSCHLGLKSKLMVKKFMVVKVGSDNNGCSFNSLFCLLH